ncbi:hypothetical protein JOF39_002937 [Glutamicibacter protophormiae]|uniref:Uncharacterized protein n=1 Tax=Glutamicibacter protophormiae TaxID=37930 RepID=A0ABS4XTK9_GLUPR|nr:hypothetical protein [Glutamicibacter protophormiae]MBP2399856.1 hypothetical protein [Glutamicibacter protophormiae]
MTAVQDVAQLSTGVLFASGPDGSRADDIAVQGGRKVEGARSGGPGLVDERLGVGPGVGAPIDVPADQRIRGVGMHGIDVLLAEAAQGKARAIVQPVLDDLFHAVPDVPFGGGQRAAGTRWKARGPAPGWWKLDP